MQFNSLQMKRHFISGFQPPKNLEALSINFAQNLISPTDRDKFETPLFSRLQTFDIILVLKVSNRFII